MMNRSLVYVVGLGPGGAQYLIAQAQTALQLSLIHILRRAAAFALPALLLAGCAAASQAPAQTDALTIENRYPLEYAKQFTVDVCAGGYDLITICLLYTSSSQR